MNPFPMHIVSWDLDEASYLLLMVISIAVGELKRDVCSCNYKMPDSISPELQTTIRKCLQTDRRKRMTVRQALKDDPWLTKNGELSCPFSDVPKTAYDEIVGEDLGESSSSSSNDRQERERRARRQFMKDLERDSSMHSSVKHTIIYHPVNPSTYFTTGMAPTTCHHHQHNAPPSHRIHQHHYHYQHENIEILRSELLQSIRTRAKRLGMRSAERWGSTTALALRLKPSEVEKANGNSSSRLYDMMQRLARSQVYCFHVNYKSSSQPNPPPSLSSSSNMSTSTSSSPSTTLSHPSLGTQHGTHSEHQHNSNLHKDFMTLLKHTCQLMGITYSQESPTRLLCVLTLREPSKEDDKKPDGTSFSSSNRPPQTKMKRRTSRSSTRSSAAASSTDEIIIGTEPFRHRRMSLPLLSHLTSSMTTSFFGRAKARPSVDEKNDKQHGQQQQQQQQQATQNKKRDSLAVFSIDIEQRPGAHATTMVALRFSRQRGSNTVFKMAGGWITGVLSLPPQD